mmetsp:Transcript_19847/g.45763  ORF Transcript_19847/g.45763 Transcript_19847/m.45763 type:complete len:322 (+) Transcript_19847:348-1313(+)
MLISVAYERRLWRRRRRVRVSVSVGATPLPDVLVVVHLVPILVRRIFLRRFLLWELLLVELDRTFLVRDVLQHLLGRIVGVLDLEGVEDLAQLPARLEPHFLAPRLLLLCRHGQPGGDLGLDLSLDIRLELVDVHVHRPLRSLCELVVVVEVVGLVVVVWRDARSGTRIVGGVLLPAAATAGFKSARFEATAALSPLADGVELVGERAERVLVCAGVVINLERVERLLELPRRQHPHFLLALALRDLRERRGRRSARDGRPFRNGAGSVVLGRRLGFVLVLVKLPLPLLWLLRLGLRPVERLFIAGVVATVVANQVGRVNV